MAAHLVSPRQIIPLFLTVSKAGLGGITGLSPTVQLRRSSDGYYLDFSDSTFKASGWVTRYATMTDLGDGDYQRIVNLNTIGVVATDVLVASYAVDDGDEVVAAANDVYNVEDLELMRQVVANRMEETPGSPGQLTLFDDDGVSVRARWEIRDVTGGAVISTVGTPSRRGAQQ